ncbi:MAG: hypothetical protein H6738_24145 [Alphaproteobacteria bacterium]|nr:hypothetical protein [Alphaproteobacteria bacterium]MCB9699901.1 hypothetical protein [Alphaproteobacteria bacterium]
MNSFRDRFQAFLELEASLELRRLGDDPDLFTHLMEADDRWFLDPAMSTFDPSSVAMLTADELAQHKTMLQPRRLFKGILHPHEAYGELASFYTSTLYEHTRYKMRFDTAMCDDQLVIVARYERCPKCLGLGSVDGQPCDFQDLTEGRCDATGWLSSPRGPDQRRLPPATCVERYEAPRERTSLALHEADSG